MSSVHLLTVLLLYAKLASPTSHWVVTEEGRIQGQVSSMFHLKRPYDLIALMEQERRVDKLEKLKHQITESNVVEAENLYEDFEDDYGFESRMFDSDPDCQSAGQPLTEFDLFAVSLTHPDEHQASELKKLLGSNVHVMVKKYKEPICDNSEDVDLGILDQLSAMKRYEELNLNPELSLIPGVLERGRFSLSEYGHLLRIALDDDPDNWVANLLASSFWRIKGNMQQTVRCLRKSIFFAPSFSRHFGLQTLSNVFHRAHRADDAIVVAQHAINLDKNNPMLHFAIANIYATKLNFDGAWNHFSECSSLDPSFRECVLRAHAVKCHVNMEAAVDNRHQNLQRTISQLKEYKHSQDTWTTVLKMITQEQSSRETRVAVTMGYEQLKILQSEDGRGQDCVQYQDMGSNIIQCALRREDSDVGYNLIKETDRHRVNKQELEALIKSFETKLGHMDTQDEQGSNWNSTDISENEDEEEEDMDDPQLPSLPPLYAEWPTVTTDITNPFDVDLLDPEWPSEESCKSDVAKPPKWDEFPTVFLSPENKGFDILRLMSSDIELPVDSAAPLPWYPPLCKDEIGRKSSSENLSKYGNMLSSVSSDWIIDSSAKTPESEIEAEYDRYSPERNFHEFGARVNAAIKMNLAPKWIVYLLAGTYFRIWGHPQNGLDCYKMALEQVPDVYLDVVLTNLAGLLYKTGNIDDALVLMKEAIHIDTKDPQANFFIANLYSAKGNMSGAVHHYRLALRMRPDWQTAFSLIHVPACHIKSHMSAVTIEDSGCDQYSDNCLFQPEEKDNSLIACKDKKCQVVTEEEAAELIHQPDFAIFRNMDSDLDQETKKEKKKKKKKKRKKKKVKEVPRPAEGEDTVLLDQEQMKHALPQGAIQIGTIAESELDDEVLLDNLGVENDTSSVSSEAPMIGPVYLQDDPLPDVLLRVREKLETPPPTQSECQDINEVNWESFTSTWLSVSAKGLDVREFLLDDYMQPLAQDLIGAHKPICDDINLSPMLSLDHLVGIKFRRHLQFAAESGLRDAFEGLTGEEGGLPIDEMATKIAMAMEKNSTSWVLSTASALYWRVIGHAPNAVRCLRHALHHAPRDMKDIPLISMANILHRAGLHNDALIVNNMALEISPKFVVIHFTMANIYVSKGDLTLATAFYLSTLALQSTFEPARDRLLSIQCQRYNSFN